MSRYNRHIILTEIGPEGQDKLSNAKVLVVGAGGLGCPVLQYLTAAGIGTIGIVDYDIVEKSNLQRQILFGTQSLGKNKAIAAKERLQDLNDTIIIKAYNEKLIRKNALELFKSYDIIVDGTDNFTTRYLINDISIITDKPVVYGAIYKFEGQVSVFNYKNGPSYRCLFPTAPPNGMFPNCSEIGVLGVLPGIIGSMQANEIIKIILGLGDILTGKLLCYNALSTQTTTLNFKRNDNQISKFQSINDTNGLQKQTISSFIPPEISIKKALTMKYAQFIDVREVHESPKVAILNPTYIPLSDFENNLNKIDQNKEKIIFCRAGIRSKLAVSILHKHGIDKSYSVTQGASEILNFITHKSSFE